MGIVDFLNSIDDYTDEERNLIPDADEFHQLYGVMFRKHDPELFEFDKAEASSCML